VGRLRTEPTMAQAEADALYAEIVAAHRDLSPEQGRRLDARLVLLLANHVGDAEVVREALRMAAARAAEMRGD
jgi:hypothetical protein